jgi:hypothetical protein
MCCWALHLSDIAAAMAAAVELVARHQRDTDMLSSSQSCQFSLLSSGRQGVIFKAKDEDDDGREGGGGSTGARVRSSSWMDNVPGPDPDPDQLLDCSAMADVRSFDEDDK